MSNLQIVEAFLKALENRAAFEDVLKFYHPDVLQIEYPNAITKIIAERSLTDLRNASERGKNVMQKEEYEIVHAYEMNDIVIIEAVWKGTLAIPLGKLAAGDVMTAYFAQFFQFKDGKIFRQRNYDCFEPFT
ncbi:MAG: nuclear transport factor 2 family protein [Parafilimonas sp.]|nr:nuclear transport factor 2 family protein [Parafilimonas sp.]